MIFRQFSDFPHAILKKNLKIFEGPKKKKGNLKKGLFCFFVGECAVSVVPEDVGSIPFAGMFSIVFLTLS